MLAVLISGSFISFIFLQALVNLKRSTTFLLIAILISPYIFVGNLSFRIELVLIPILMALLLIKKATFKTPVVIGVLLSFFLWILFSTLISLFRGVEGSLLFTTMYGLIRLMLVSFLFANMNYTLKEVFELLRFFVYCSIPLGLLGMGQALHSSLATAITLQFYSSSNRGSIASQLEQVGFLSRSISVFESPSFAATYFLLAVGIGIWLLLHFYSSYRLLTRLALILGVIASFISGLFTLSATFVAGIIILFLWLLIWLRWRVKARFLLLSWGGILLVSPLAFLVIGNSSVAAGSLVYQWNRLLSSEVFETRLNEQDGLLATTLEAVKERPLLGWGFIGQKDIFLGDSLYLLWMYFGGIVAWIIFSMILGLIIYYSLNLGAFGEVMLLIIVMLLAVGFGSPSFTIPRLSDWWWALVGILLSGRRSWKNL